MVKKLSIIYKTGLLFLALTISLGLVGYSAASWNVGLANWGSAVTGNIDPVFTRASVDCVGNSVGSGKVDIDIDISGGKTMLIRMEGIRPGTQVVIDYTITNRGSVPVKFANQSTSGDFTVTNEFPDGVIKGNNGTGDGKITIIANKTGKKGSCIDALNFDLGMVFSQWNALENGELRLILQQP